MATVIAYGTGRQGYFDLFMESCRRHGIDPVILGWKEKWTGFGKKTRDIAGHLGRLPEDEIVISVDPFDVIFLCGLDEIEQKFSHCGSEFLSGALRLGPFMGYIYSKEFNKTGKPVPRTPSDYNHLNAGTWISRAGYAVRFIDMLVKEHRMKDTDMEQTFFTGIYINDGTRAGIDWRCDIFHNLLFTDFITRKPDMKDIEFRGGRIYNRATGTYPCIIHASGNALMEVFAENLGYEKKFSLPAGGRSNFLRKAFFHILHLGWIGYAIIFLAVSLIFLIFYSFR